MAAYGKEQIHHVHDDQDEQSNAGVVVAVARRNQGRGDEVVAKHLPVVLAAVFDVDDDNLLQPKSPLGKHVELEEAAHLAVRPVRPQLSHVQPGGRIGIQVL